MASSSLDLVRSIYADWERGNFGETGWADPQIEWVTVDGPSPSELRGLEPRVPRGESSLPTGMTFALKPRPTVS